MTKEIIEMKGWIKESILLKKAQEFNGRIKTLKDLFEHMERLQKCTSCKRDFYDKWCPSCCIPKSILHNEIEELLEDGRTNFPHCQKLRIRGELLGEDFEEINHKAIVGDNKELESFKKALRQDIDEIFYPTKDKKYPVVSVDKLIEFEKRLFGKGRQLTPSSEKNAWGRTYNKSSKHHAGGKA